MVSINPQRRENGRLCIGRTGKSCTGKLSVALQPGPGGFLTPEAGRGFAPVDVYVDTGTLLNSEMSRSSRASVGRCSARNGSFKPIFWRNQLLQKSLAEQHKTYSIEIINDIIDVHEIREHFSFTYIVTAAELSGYPEHKQKVYEQKIKHPLENFEAMQRCRLLYPWKAPGHFQWRPCFWFLGGS